jgi:hypothetical protein
MTKLKIITSDQVKRTLPSMIKNLPETGPIGIGVGGIEIASVYLSNRIGSGRKFSMAHVISDWSNILLAIQIIQVKILITNRDKVVATLIPNLDYEHPIAKYGKIYTVYDVGDISDELQALVDKIEKSIKLKE